MLGLGPIEILIVLVVALLIVGPKKLPETGRSLGSSLRELKAGITAGDKDSDRTKAHNGEADVAVTSDAGNTTRGNR